MSIGVGIVFTAKDLASKTIKQIGNAFNGLDADLKHQQAAFKRNAVAFGAGLATIGAGAKLLQIPASFVEQAAKVEDTMFQLKSVSGLSMKEIDRLRNSFLRLSADLPVSALEMSKVSVIAGQLGINSVKDIEAFTQTVIKTSKVLPELSPELAAEGLAQLKNILELSTPELVNLSSAMIKMKTTSTATGVDLIQSSRRFGGFAKKMGFTADQVIAFAAAFRDAGVTADVGATAFQILFTTISTRTDKFAKVMGMSTAQLKQNLAKDFPKTIGSFIESLKKVPSSKVPGMLKELGLSGSRTIPVMLGLTKAGVNLEQKLKDSAEAYANATLMQERFIELTKSLNSRLDILKGALANVAIALGTPLLEPAKQAVNFFLNNFINPFFQALQKTPSLAKTVTMSIIGIGTALIGLGSLVAGVTGFAILEASMAALGLTFGGIAATIGGAIASIIPPILIVTGVIVAAVSAWNNNFMGFRDFAFHAISQTKLIFRSLVALLSGKSVSSIEGFKFMSEGTKTIVQGFIRAKDTVMQFVNGVIDGFMNLGGMEALEELATSAGNFAIALFDAVGATLQLVGEIFGIRNAMGIAEDNSRSFGQTVAGVFRIAIAVVDGFVRAATWVLNAWSAVSNWFSGTFGGVVLDVLIIAATGANPLIGVAILVIRHWSGVKGIFNAIHGAIMTVADAAGTAGSILGSLFAGDFSAAYESQQAFFDRLAGNLDTTTEKANTAGNAIGNGIKSGADDAASAMQRVANMTDAEIQRAVQSATTGFQSIGNEANIAMSAVDGAIAGAAAGTGQAGQTAASNTATALQGVQAQSQTTTSSIKTGFNETQQAITLAGQKGSQDVITALQGIVPKSQTVVQGVQTNFATLPNKLGVIGTNAGNSLINNLISAIQNGTGRLGQAVKSMIDKAVKSQLEGRSPPKEGPMVNILKWGENIAETFGEGIVLNANAPTKAVHEMLRPMESVLSSPEVEPKVTTVAMRDQVRPRMDDIFYQPLEQKQESQLEDQLQTSENTGPIELIRNIITLDGSVIYEAVEQIHRDKSDRSFAV